MLEKCFLWCDLRLKTNGTPSICTVSFLRSCQFHKFCACVQSSDLVFLYVCRWFSSYHPIALVCNCDSHWSYNTFTFFFTRVSALVILQIELFISSEFWYSSLCKSFYDELEKEALNVPILSKGLNADTCIWIAVLLHEPEVHSGSKGRGSLFWS